MIIKKILVVRNDRFGEFLLVIPALRSLKASFAGSSITLAVDSYVQELAAGIDCVDEIIIWDRRRHSFKEMVALSGQLRKKHFDLCVIFNPSKEFNIISFLAGIPRRAGYARKWGFLLTTAIPDAKHLAQMHEVEYNLALAQAAGAAIRDTRIGLYADARLAGEVFKGWRGSGPFIAVHPFTSDSRKQWPLENFQELALELGRALSARVIIIGGKEEKASYGHMFNAPG